MKTFLYRGKSEKTGEWVYGQLLHNECRNESYIITNCNLSPIAVMVAKFAVKVNDATVCTKVGEDHNGNPIFEQDIVENVSWNEFFSGLDIGVSPFKRTFVVAFSECKAILIESFDEYTPTNVTFDMDNPSDYNVIGNTFDNPEKISLEFIKKLPKNIFDMSYKFNEQHHYLDEPKSYTSNINDYQTVYDNRFNELMEKSKKDLIEMIIGPRPIYGPLVSYHTNYNSPFENF